MSKTGAFPLQPLLLVAATAHVGVSAQCERHVLALEAGEIGQCEPRSLLDGLKAWWMGQAVFLVLQCPTGWPWASCSGSPLAPASEAMVEDMLSSS